MLLSKNEILKLAELSRISINEAELKVYQEQLSEVLGYFNKIKSLKLDKIKESLSGAEEAVLWPREDKIAASTPATINQAAGLKNNYVVSPQVVEKK